MVALLEAAAAATAAAAVLITLTARTVWYVITALRTELDNCFLLSYTPDVNQA